MQLHYFITLFVSSKRKLEDLSQAVQLSRNLFPDLGNDGSVPGIEF